MKSLDVYSSFKAAKYPEKIEQIRKDELPAPTQVQVDLTNVCNLNCSFCFYRQTWNGGMLIDEWNNKLFIPTKNVIEMLDDMQEMGIKGLHVTGGGSPECHPDFDYIIDEGLKREFEMAIATNGTLLNEKRLEKLVKFKWIRFSVDTSNAETFKIIKGAGTGTFDKVINNIKRLVVLRKEYKDVLTPEDCIIGFSVIVCNENWKEIFECAKLAKELGCQNIRYSLAHTPQGDKIFEGDWIKIEELLENAKKLEDDTFKVFSFKNRINELRGDYGPQMCNYHHFVAAVSPTGVYPCCFFKDKSRYNFGRLQDQRFIDIWYGEKRKEFIKRINKFGCTGWCWMRDKNNFINYLLEEDVPHKCFI